MNFYHLRIYISVMKYSNSCDKLNEDYSEQQLKNKIINSIFNYLMNFRDHYYVLRFS